MPGHRPIVKATERPPGRGSAATAYAPRTTRLRAAPAVPSAAARPPSPNLPRVSTARLSETGGPTGSRTAGG